VEDLATVVFAEAPQDLFPLVPLLLRDEIPAQKCEDSDGSHDDGSLQNSSSVSEWSCAAQNAYEVEGLRGHGKEVGRNHDLLDSDQTANAWPTFETQEFTEKTSALKSTAQM
jgi:hypothetical protein